MRCDGLVASTPAGSTGYNLANGGPVLAWGVEGYVGRFIAPHTLTARALVAAPGDVLSVDEHRPPRRAWRFSSTAGRSARSSRASAPTCRFEDNETLLAQLPGSTFYHRFRDKFGKLAKPDDEQAVRPDAVWYKTACFLNSA